MNKHTPGPWRVIERPESTIWIQGPPDENGYREVCTLPDYMLLKRETTKANASLIASAPELLEALKIAQAQIRLYAEYAKEMKKIGRGYEPTAYGYSPEYFDGIMSAAIAKATGGEK